MDQLSPPLVTIADVQAAARRIAGRVRRTPLMAAAPVRGAPGWAAGLTLKLESLQVTGSFKARGACNAAAALTPEQMRRGLVTASGGNHGLAVAYAGSVAGVPTTVYLPDSAPAAKRRRLEAWGATVVVTGAVWDDSNAAALGHAARDGLHYIHPFADPLVIAGQGTVATEILADAPDTDTLLVAIGGGGLVSGIASASCALKPGIRIVGVEPAGAATLHGSLRAGQPVTLDRIETAAGSLAPRATEALPFAIVQRHVSEIVLVSDAEMRDAAAWLWGEHGVAAEMAGAASVAALLTGRYRPAPGERVCAVICGAGTDGMPA